MAGRTPTRALAPGEAAVIMTGAPPRRRPPSSWWRRPGGRGLSWSSTGPSSVPGRTGCSAAGRCRPGTSCSEERLNAARLGLLASVGRPEVARLAATSCGDRADGDELVEPEAIPGPGQIRNSNAVMLRPWPVRPVPTSSRSRSPRMRRRSFEHARARAAGFDVLLITGGVSAGNRDLVPGDPSKPRGDTRLPLKSGSSPASRSGSGVGPARGEAPGTLVFGLPGNPVSGIVGFLLFVRPVLLALASREENGSATSQRPLARAFVHASDRPTYFPARLAADATVEPLDWAGSADLRTVAQADGFAVFPAGDRHYASGRDCRFPPFGLAFRGTSRLRTDRGRPVPLFDFLRRARGRDRPPPGRDSPNIQAWHAKGIAVRSAWANANRGGSAGTPWGSANVQRPAPQGGKERSWRRPKHPRRPTGDRRRVDTFVRHRPPPGCARLVLGDAPLVLVPANRLELAGLGSRSLLFMLVGSHRSRFSIYFGAWTGGMLFWTLSIQWVRLTDSDAWLAWLVMALVLSVWWPGFLLLTRFSVLRLRIPLMVAGPAIWVGLEFVRAHILTGFPWYYLAHTQHRTLPLIQIADTTGALGVSVLIALVNAWLVDLRTLPSSRQRPEGTDSPVPNCCVR